jgi:hypothetical protein
MAALVLYFFEGISADFSEERLKVPAPAGPVGSCEAVARAVSQPERREHALVSLDLRKVKVSFVGQLARPGGVALGLEASLFGGSLRADVSLAVRRAWCGFRRLGFSRGCGSACVVGFSWQGRGVIREVRFTFAHPGALDGQVAELAADGFR